MRISDWSSDVCSSDLQREGARDPRVPVGIALRAAQGGLADAPGSHPPDLGRGGRGGPDKPDHGRFRRDRAVGYQVPARALGNRQVDGNSRQQTEKKQGGGKGKTGRTQQKGRGESISRKSG